MIAQFWNTEMNRNIFQAIANLSKEEKYHLPEGKWNVLINKVDAGIKILNTVKKELVRAPSTGVVLKRKNT